ncbi:hypothetical protein ACFZBM_36585 [Streptomyces lavendulae]|uniref:hypothetical protein n=1 Tax=Streptomyces lavendulae TaxID=1914 RepID=UPI0036EF99F0
MRRHHHDNATLMPTLPGDMWHALASLHGAHADPVGNIPPLDRPDAFLSLTRPGDIAFTARVELSGGETIGHLHKLITALTCGITSTYELGAAAPCGTALEIMVGKRHQLALHSGYVLGLTQLLRHAVDTIDAHAASGDGLCCHCYGTGRAHPCGRRRPRGLRAWVSRSRPRASPSYKVLPRLVHGPSRPGRRTSA